VPKMWDSIYRPPQNWQMNIGRNQNGTPSGGGGPIIISADFVGSYIRELSILAEKVPFTMREGTPAGRQGSQPYPSADFVGSLI